MVDCCSAWRGSSTRQLVEIAFAVVDGRSWARDAVVVPSRGRLCFCFVTMPAVVASAKPLRRLRVKTSWGKRTQKPVVTLDDWGAQEQSGARRQVYLVTFPHPKVSHSTCGRKLVAPGTKTKRQILDCLLDSCKNPAYSDGRSLAWKNEVHLKFAGVWQEFHQPDPAGVAHAHDHATVLALPKKQFAFLPVKKALLSRHGLASHWSCTHNGYWSAIRYVCVPSPKKPADTLDIEPVLWAVDGEHRGRNSGRSRIPSSSSRSDGCGLHLPGGTSSRDAPDIF